MLVDLVTVAYNSDRALEDLVASARNHCRCEVRVRLFLHSENAPTVVSCERVAKSDWVTYADGSDVVIVVNDDICFGEATWTRSRRTRCSSGIVTSLAAPVGISSTAVQCPRTASSASRSTR